ncbi:MAG: lasso peptide biosynthesis B2 protein [Thermoanaerobaculia bacterium]
MKSRLRKLLALTREERRALALAWAYLLVSDLALRILPLPRVERLLSRLSTRRREPGLSPGRLAQLTGIAARHHLRPMVCLPQSLALQALLRRQGLSAELRIGVRRADGKLQAHAWVEHAGSPLGETAPYLPLGRSM